MDRELDRGTEEVMAIANTTTYIDNNGELVEKINYSGLHISHSDSSETSMNDLAQLRDGNGHQVTVNQVSWTV
jgi:hypothetical protein